MSAAALKRQQFARHFMGDAQGNATKAAVLAGYSERSAKQIGSRLLTYDDVKRTLARVAEKADTTTAKALERIAAIAAREPDKFSAGDVLRANELLLKANGALRDGKGDSRITVNVGFIQGQPPLVSITNTTDIDAAANADVMPQLPHASESRD